MVFYGVWADTLTAISHKLSVVIPAFNEEIGISECISLVPFSRIVLFVNTRTDSVSKTSNFHRMSNGLTLQQGLELLLNPR